MGVVIPQVIAEDRASGAQIIDGSLKFERSDSNYLKKTISTTGNQQTFTVSFWFKKQLVGNVYQYLFTTEYLGSGSYFEITSNSDQFHVYGGSGVIDVKITRKLRDTDGWMHAVVSIDSTIATPASDRVKIYLNGERQEDYVSGSDDFPPQNHLFTLEGSRDWYIGTAEFQGTVSSSYYDGHMSNFYFVDGQALGPEEFGFTDPLTNTWRPKKYTGEFARSSPNDGTWNATSSLSTTDSISSSTPAGNAFDGDLTTRVQTTNAQAGIALTFAPNNAGINFTTSLEVYCDQGTNVPTATWNGNTVNPGQNQWVTVYSGSGELSSTYPLTINTETATQYATLVGVRVDGEILIDGLNNTGVNSFHLPMDGNSPVGEDKSGQGNDWTPWYFGGSNSIEKATGALPILNTVSGGKVATVGVRTDAFANNLVLALPLVGNANDVSNQINSGSTTKSVAANNNVGFSDAQSNFYGGSFYFDGNATETSAKYLEVASGLNFSQDFTVEMWFYKTTTQDYGVLFDCWNAQTSGDGWYSWIAGGRIDTVKDSSTYYYGSGDSVILDDTWNHVAYVRDNNVFKVFSNGVFQYSFNITDSWTSTKCWIGSGQGNGSMAGFYGYIQDVRIYQTAKYTENFIPASTNPDILPDTPSGVSGSSELAKIANGSVGFAGTSRLSIGTNDDIGLYSDNFTIEGFFNKVTTTGNQTLLASQNYYTAGYSGNWVLRITDNSYIAFSSYDGQSNQELSEFAAPNGVNRWYHFALVREGTGSTQTKFYFDGKFAGSMTLSKSLSDSGSHGIFIGHDDGYNNDLNGHISNVRIVKGTAVYTSDFTPPTEPLTNITNTKLLCAQSTSEHKDITGRLYKSSGTLYTTKADIIANATPLEGGETLYGDYFYYVPSGNELTRQQVFSADGAITNDDSSNSWSWMRHDGTNWLAITGGYSPGQFDEFYFDADDTSYQLDPGRDFYALTLLNGTSPSLHKGTAPTLKKQFALDGAVIPSSTNPVIHQLYEPTVSNFNPFDTDINTVRGQETNHCTLNPITSNNTEIVLSEGNLHFEKHSTLGSWGSVYGTIGMTTGKWYWEAEATGVVDENLDFGVTTPDVTAGGWFNGTYGLNVGYTVVSDGDNWGFAIDMDNRTVQLYKNGIEYQTSTGAGTYAVTPNIIPDTVETLFPCVASYGQYRVSPAGRARVNFGQNPFKFPPPDGFQPLNDANLKLETVIARPDQYVGVTTYPGNPSQTQSIKLNMQPDLVWIKSRFVDSANHILTDSVRGDHKELYSNNNQNESDPGYGVEIKSNGFTVPGVADNRLNGTNRDYVAWAWKAGGNKNTFNVDDVGYANASDVNMNVGALNSTIYDQSQTWSSNSTLGSGNIISDAGSVDHVVSRIFDGDSSTSCIVEKGTASGEVSLDLTSSITGVTKIRVQTSSVDNFNINGGSNIASTGNGYETIYDGSAITLTSLKFIRTSGVSGGQSDTGFSVTSVEINGKQLIDSGVTPSINLPSIAPTGCSVGTKQGFSIISYTGTGGSNDETISHGLSQSPDMVIIKNRLLNTHISWAVAHTGTDSGNNRQLKLDTNDDVNDVTFLGLNKSNFTSTTFAVNASDNADNYVNASNNFYIAYVWHNVPGLQKFGRYEGNGDTNGPYVELGFKPAILWLKNIDDNENWYVYDTERMKSNPAYQTLQLSHDGIEENGSTNTRVDLLSNGFKLRQSNGPNNANTYIYAAWAEVPSVSLYGGQSNAR